MKGGAVSRPLYVTVEGPIGVGKTTLVRRLRDRLQSRLVLEVVEENPFLPLFYQDRERYAFQTQLFFLMSRFRATGTPADRPVRTRNSVGLSPSQGSNLRALDPER